MKQTFLLTLLTSSVLMGLAAAQTGETEVPMGDALFALFGGDGDGSVSAEEFTAGIFTPLRPRRQRLAQPGRVQRRQRPLLRRALRGRRLRPQL